jgi:hypothetical protein
MSMIVETRDREEKVHHLYLASDEKTSYLSISYANGTLPVEPKIGLNCLQAEYTEVVLRPPIFSDERFSLVRPSL